MKHIGTSLALASAMLLATDFAAAQNVSDPSKRADPTEIRTFYLRNMTQSNDANSIVNALRQMMEPAARIYLDSSDNAHALLVKATPEQLAIATRIVDDLDKAKKQYRLTFTAIESDSGKQVGLQRFTMVVASGERSSLKDGSKLPIATGPASEGSSAQTPVTYLDIGLNFDATVEDVSGGISLKSKVEQSSSVQEQSSAGPLGPIVRQAVLEGTSILALGKPLTLGAFDVPGSTRHLEFVILAELVK